MSNSIYRLTALVAALAAGGAFGADQPATAPGTTRPAATQPTTQASPEARAVLDQVAAAYRDAKTLQLGGSFASDIDADGRQVKKTAKFTTSFEAPFKFNHNIDEQMSVVSNGEKVYVYEKRANAFLAVDAPKDKAGEADFPGVLNKLLEMHPALRLALAKDPGAVVARMFSKAEKVADTDLDGVAYPTLKNSDAEDARRATVLVDPKSHLIRKVTFDLGKYFESQGVPNVKVAQITIDYAAAAVDGPVDATAFAWTPPAGARDLAQQKGGGDEESPAAALEGKPAPDFKLTGLDDKPVQLSDLKGSVVVLDFWATWCGPCVQSLPHLDQVYKDVKDSGVKIYAVNAQEDKDKVQNFVTSKNLSVPVLLDTDGAVLKAYLASGIPQTVIIGKDGQVRKVMVGFGPGTEQTLRSELKAAQEAGDAKK